MTKKQIELLECIHEETKSKGFLSIAMAAYYMNTTSQAVSRMAMKLVKLNKIWRDSNLNMYPIAQNS